MDISHKVALVTGASKGIGRAVAIALAQRKAHVVICARDKKRLDDTARMIEAVGSKVCVIVADLRQKESIDHVVQKAVDTFGTIDILINNAGLGYFAKISELTVDQWDAMFALNVRSVFLLTQQALPHLRNQGESVILNVVSLAGKNAFVGGTGYAATKHALLGFSRCLMLEERANGVRVMAICPGSVDTHFFDDHADRENIKQIKILNADDIAATIVNMISMPQHALISEVDIRPTNP
jgi:3-oxoacyl-[acyl-carrier protein] reductase